MSPACPLQSPTNLIFKLVALLLLIRGDICTWCHDSVLQVIVHGLQKNIPSCHNFMTISLNTRRPGTVPKGGFRGIAWKAEAPPPKFYYEQVMKLLEAVDTVAFIHMFRQ